MTRTRMVPSKGRTVVGRDVQSMVDRLFDDVLGDVVGRTRWDLDLGATDIYEFDGTLWIETALPGLSREDIQVRVKDGQLIVRGTHHQEREIPEENFLYRGRPSGQFETAFPLPDSIQDPENIQAHFENGILRIQVPLSQSLVNPGIDIDVQ